MNLTERQRQVADRIARGMCDKEISRDLGLSAGTVKVHLMHIFEKTGLKDRFALAVHGRNLPGIASQPERAT